MNKCEVCDEDMSTKKLPLITIVTVVYNGEKTIQETICSCTEQVYCNVEYIVIDGKSTDSTVDIISKFKNKVTRFISEPDNGIYDAMNKAITIATGDWIIFMNSGDLFFDKFVLSNVAKLIKEEESSVDVIYGNTVYKFKNNLLQIMPLAFELIEREMIFCHQSTFVRTELIKLNRFDLKYKLAADYNMFYQFYKQNRIFKHVDLFISIFNQDEGSTLNNFKKSTKERYSIHDDYGSFKNSFLLYKTILKIQISLLKKKILPMKLNHFFFQIKYKANILPKK